MYLALVQIDLYQGLSESTQSETPEAPFSPSVVVTEESSVGTRTSRGVSSDLFTTCLELTAYRYIHIYMHTHITRPDTFAAAFNLKL